jgi:type IV pilus assembly protein PilV
MAMRSIRRYRTLTRPPRGDSGFTLVEVLVALVVLAIGLLGIAMMQTTALTANQGGYLRSQAVLQVQDIVERMRANAQGVGEGLYNDIPDTIPTDPGTCSPCTPAQLQARDHYEWAKHNDALLPQGKGKVVSADGVNFDISLEWMDRANQGDAALTQAEREAVMKQELKITVRL